MESALPGAPAAAQSFPAIAAAQSFPAIAAAQSFPAIAPDRGRLSAQALLGRYLFFR